MTLRRVYDLESDFLLCNPKLQNGGIINVILDTQLTHIEHTLFLPPSAYSL